MAILILVSFGEQSPHGTFAWYIIELSGDWRKGDHGSLIQLLLAS